MRFSELEGSMHFNGLGHLGGNDESFRLPGRQASRSRAAGAPFKIGRRRSVRSKPDFGSSFCVCDLESSMASMGDSSKMSSSRMSNSIMEQHPSMFEQSVKFTASNFVAQNEDSLDKHYIIGELLGEGGFGEVFSCIHIQRGEERAVKVIHKQFNEEDERVLAEFDIVKVRMFVHLMSLASLSRELQLIHLNF